MKKKYDIGILFAAVFIVMTGILFCCDYQEDKGDALDIRNTADTADTAEENGSGLLEPEDIQMTADSSPGVIYVYVCGCVNQPDVYALDSGARLYEAIAAAGGACENADLDRLNLAASIQDGDKIYVPAEGESEAPSEDMEAIEAADGRLNINTATSQQLQELPGIGEAKANAIIAYREARGPFSSVEELMQVPGIKDGVYGQVESLIRVD